MKNIGIIERFGGITKEEPLSTLDKDLVMEGTQVLESRRPFFSYYDDCPELVIGSYHYLVLNGHHPFEVILRAVEEIKKIASCDFDATLGNTTMGSRTCPVIRVKKLKQYCQVKEVQGQFQKQGIEFKKHFTTFQNQMVLIRLQKFFYLQPYDGGIYMDRDLENLGYFTIPEFIPWDEFRKLTVKAKYQTELLFFDAATAYIYENRKIVNLVRIYKEGITAKKMIPIRDRYLKLISEE